MALGLRLLRLLRDGKEIQLNVALAEMPSKLLDQASDKFGSEGHAAPDLGMQLQALTPELRHRLEVPAEVTQGVVITDLNPSSDAARAGLRPGDVVLEINRQRVATPADLQRLWQATKGNILALVLRKGSTNYIIAIRRN